MTPETKRRKKNSPYDKETEDRNKKRQMPIKNAKSNVAKSVVVIGTSNTKIISKLIIREEKINIDKVIKYTLKETNDYINNEMSSSPDAIV